MTSMLSGASLDAVVTEVATARLEEAELRAKLAFIFKDPKAAESFEGKLAQRKLNMEKENKNAGNDLDILRKTRQAAKKIATKAVRIDPASAMSYVALGYTLMGQETDETKLSDTTRDKVITHLRTALGLSESMRRMGRRRQVCR